MSSETVSPRTTFDWAIYADATLAGLAILIPIPLLDVFVEWLFKRRIPQAVARRNGRRLDPYTVYHLNNELFSCLGCLLWPIALLLLFLKRLFRTILYFLTIKEASDKLSLYWHRAFLIDYMVRRGDLDNEHSAKIAAAALRELLNNLTTSPLHQLAQQVIGSMHHIFRTIWRWRRQKREDADLKKARLEMAMGWDRFQEYLETVGAQYVQIFDRLQAAHLAAQIQPGPDANLHNP